VDLLEGDDGGVVFLWGMAAWCWDAGDIVGRRAAAVQLVATGAATQVGVSAAFDVDDATLRRWQRAWESGGIEALAGGKKGPKGPIRLTEEKVAEIVALRSEGRSMEAIAGVVGVSLNSVSRALKASSKPEPALSAGGSGLEPLARPESREAERQAARSGLLTGAAPVITEGAGLPMGGALVILPALAVTGLLETAAAIYGTTRAAFYGLRSLVLAVVFSALLGEPRAEGLTRIDPGDLGRLLALDRAPEVKTLRRRMEELARRGRSDELITALARHHLEANTEAVGLFYVDGHVRAYHGSCDVPKAHLARMRLSMPAEHDTWTVDARGDGLLVWQAPPGASLVGELRKVTAEIRGLVGPDAQPTICFDRGGWSPALFAQLVAAGFHILTYRKGEKPLEPRRSFRQFTHIDETGRAHDYWLADRKVRIAYKQRGKSRYFACRQITRLDPDSGHQTQILTTRTDDDPAALAHAMFSRWRQENFFRYLRAHYALDGLDSYTSTDDQPDREVPNPAKRTAGRELAAARARLADAEATEGRATLAGGRPTADIAAIKDAFDAARAHMAELEAAYKAIPARVPLATTHPGARRLDPERKRIHDAIRMATYNSESRTARLLAPHYARAEDEARSLLREIYHAPADLEVIDHQLHVRINPLSAPRRTRALAALCHDLTATQTTYPGTNLTLTYSVKTL
jgi:transposase-like protein